MKVIICAKPLRGSLSGIGRYTYCLVKSLEAQGRPEELVLFRRGKFLPVEHMEQILSPKPDPGDPRPKVSLAARLRQVAIRNVALVRAVNATSAQLNRWALRHCNAQDIFHSTNYGLPPFRGKKVVTIADLSTLRFPESHPAARVNLVNRQLQDAVDSAAHIITISEFVKKEITAHYRLDPDRVSTTYLGADDSIGPVSIDEFAPIATSLGIEYKQYFLFISTIEPRKNLDRLLDAFVEYTEQQGSNTMPLVIAGAPGWKSDAIHGRIRELEYSNAVKYLGYVDQAMVPLLVGGARALLYPSLYEGFGLPVIEAMKSDTAVMTSRDSAMSEIAGDAAALVSPVDVESMAGAIVRLATDDTYNAGLVSRGRERAARFTWAHCARDTLAAYEKAGAQ